MRNTFIKVLFEAAKKDKDIIFITGDLGFSVVEEFANELPSQFINAGIAEQNMTGVAAGMALSGKKVFTYSIANFASLRCLEQIRNDICYHNANVTIVSIGAGFMYGSQGYTHHGLEDAAILRTIPNMNVCVPSNEEETGHAVKLILKSNEPFYLKLGKTVHNLKASKISGVRIGSINEIKGGTDVLIAAQGSILEEAVIAYELLKEKGISCAIWSVPWLKPLDKSLIEQASAKFKLIMTLEEAQIYGGLGSAFAEIISTSIASKSKLIIKGVPDSIVHQSISQLNGRFKFQLDGNSLAAEIWDILQK